MKSTFAGMFPVFALALVLAGCNTEESGAPGENGSDITEVEMAAVIEDADVSTRLDITSNSGKATWTAGDQVGIYVIDSQGNSTGYHVVPVDIDPGSGYSKVTVPLNVTESLAGYAIYPVSAANGSDTDPAGSSPSVIYPKEYDLSEHAGSVTFVPAPMMAVNGGDVLRFFHVGSLVRLSLMHVPSTTASIAVTFSGMTDVAGICTVSQPGTASATTSVIPGCGFGNTITLTGFTVAADGMLTLNIPVPTGDYSSLDNLQVIARDSGETITGAVFKTIQRSEPEYNWGVLEHGYGRLVPVDFSAGGLLGGVTLNDDSPVTLWKSKTVTRSAQAFDGEGRPYGGAALTWSSSDLSVASVTPSDGIVTGVGPGVATITVTATPLLGGDVQTDSYTVYVNAITEMELASAADIIERDGGATMLTLTLTHTNYGTITSFPDDVVTEWATSRPDYVSLANLSYKPGRLDDTHATVVVNAVGAGLGGNSVISATLRAAYSLGISSFTRNYTIRSKEPTHITTTTPYTFNGIEMSPGLLMTPSEGTWGLTSGEDPFELLPHLFRTTADYLDYPRLFVTWHELKEYFDGTYANAPMQHSVRTIFYGGYEWILPANTDWMSIIAQDIVPGSVVTNDRGEAEGTHRFIKVNVDLTGTSYGYRNASGNAVKTCPGLLLLPDNAAVSCFGLLEDLDGNNALFNNNVDYDDIITLVAGGCIFLPSAGFFTSGGNWTTVVSNGRQQNAGHYLASTNATGWKDSFQFANNGDNQGGPRMSVIRDNEYAPAHLIKKTH